MKNLPQRPREHVLEDETQDFVKSILPKEWLTKVEEKDYGIDLSIEIVEDANVTGAHFLMQLKSTDKLVVNKKGLIPHTCKTSTLQYFLERPELVVYLVYDAVKKVGYWVWIQDYIRNALPKKWREQKTATIKIPAKSLFTKQSIETIRKRVLSFHRKEKIINTLENLNHPGIRYGIEFDGYATKISAYPKYLGAERDYPVSVGFTLNFDSSEEGRLAHKSWQDVFKKGIGAKISSRFIKDINFSETFDPNMFSDDEFKPDELMIYPLRRKKKFVAKIEVFNKEYKLVSQVPYVEFREIRYGTDEILMSNEEQSIPTKFSILLNLLENKSTISFKLNFGGWNVSQVKDVLNLQQSFALGGWLHLVHVDTDIVVLKSSFPENVLAKPLDIHVATANDLTLIQKKMNSIFPWPEKISLEDQYLIKKVIDIITKGESVEGGKIGFGFEKMGAQKLAEAYSKNQYIEIKIEGESEKINLFGQELDFGPARILLSRAKPTKKTVERLSTLDLLDDDAIVQLDLDVDEPGVIIQYLNWLPKDKTIGD
jgi:hypothetical protein